MNVKMILSSSLLALAGVASAQTATEITDPAKIAEIERHAQQLQSQPMASGMDKMHHKGAMHHKAKMHHAKKMKATKAEMKMPAEASSDTPMQQK